MIKDEVLIKIDKVLKNDFLLVFKTFTVFVIFVKVVQSFSNKDGDVVANFDPYIVVDVTVVSDSLEDLNKSDDYVNKLFFELFLLGLFVPFESGELSTLFYHRNFLFDEFVELLKFSYISHVFVFLGILLLTRFN